MKIYDDLYKWWQAESFSTMQNKNLSQDDNDDNDFGSIYQEMKGRFAHIPQMLSEIIIPRFNKDIILAKENEIILWLAKIAELDIPCAKAYVALLRFSDVSVKTGEIIHELMTSNNTYFVYHAHEAVVLWLKMHNAGHIKSKCPSFLIDIWETSILFRVEGCLDHWYLQILDNDLHSINLSKIELALKYLLSETNLDDDLYTYIELRKRAARLAFCTYQHMDRHKIKIPSVIEDWKVASQKSPLLELRDIWM